MIDVCCNGGGKAMPTRLVICCDGTGNEIDDNHSNVLKLYRVLKRNSSQRVFYDPGIGTLGASSDWARLRQNTEKFLSLALGLGLDRNVLRAYRFLVRHYRDGDKIYLYGFSRGAYTVRILAGMINSIGLLAPEQCHLAGYALVSYKRITEENSFGGVRLFEKTLRATRPPIRFLGLWDTVSSVIVPRRDRLYVPSLRQLAYTKRNPSVEIVRHAVAIDEKRRMFRPYLWTENQDYWGGPFPSNNPVPQDVQQLWFAGCHSDIGGGYPELESGLAKLALEWMIDESPPELEFSTQSVNQVVRGQPRAGSQSNYAKPDALGPSHRSLRGAWQLLEWLPKSVKHRSQADKKDFLGYYLPRGELRHIDASAAIHPTVIERRNGNIGYAPANLP